MNLQFKPKKHSVPSKQSLKVRSDFWKQFLWRQTDRGGKYSLTSTELDQKGQRQKRWNICCTTNANNVDNNNNMHGWVRADRGKECSAISNRTFLLVSSDSQQLVSWGVDALQGALLYSELVCGQLGQCRQNLLIAVSESVTNTVVFVGRIFRFVFCFWAPGDRWCCCAHTYTSQNCSDVVSMTPSSCMETHHPNGCTESPTSTDSDNVKSQTLNVITCSSQWWAEFLKCFYIATRITTHLSASGNQRM